MQDGWTPLHLAIQSRNRDIAKVLLVNGADKTRRTKVLFHIFADKQYTPKEIFYCDRCLTFCVVSQNKLRSFQYDDVNKTTL
jgi:ankyrin repeat protein